MKVIKSIKETQLEVLDKRKKGLSVGFVPTMGALHQGHLSLLERSIEENDISVCSIFVNPIQFNNKEDLVKYPRTLDEDCHKLEKAGCDIVFAPSTDEMYPEEVTTTYDFGSLERVMEGAHRPGHFNGVGVVVKKLFDICIPHKAYFGEKDFQQLMIIRKLVELENIAVEIVGCPIIREEDGLAMSSRNVRLSAPDRKIAPEIFQTLQMIRSKAGNIEIGQLIKDSVKQLEAKADFKVEYIQIVDERTLMPVESWDDAENLRVFIAAFLGDVRLIDNVEIT